MSKNEAQSTSETKAKPRTASRESVLKMDLRHTRKDLAKAIARADEFDALRAEMESHADLVQGLIGREAGIKAELIAELGLE